MLPNGQLESEPLKMNLPSFINSRFRNNQIMIFLVNTRKYFILKEVLFYLIVKTFELLPD